MLRAIIIDDEEGARIMLAALLRASGFDIEIVASCANVPEGVLAINKHNPDVVFLDIEMPEYNGFELFDFIKDVRFDVVFVTAYSQYAIRAFEVSAIDYLLKPVEPELLQGTLKKVSLKKDHVTTANRLELMKSTYQGQEVQKIALPMSDGLLFVEVNRIVLFEADRAYTDIYLNDGSKITVSKPMRTFEDILENRQHFFRPHRSFLINLHYLKKYIKGDSLLVLDNDISVSISRDRKQDFELLLKELRMAF
jgi:two-component system, LytTR family, response regulator